MEKERNTGIGPDQIKKDLPIERIIGLKDRLENIEKRLKELEQK